MLWFFITAPGLALFACQNAPALAQLAPIHGPTILLTASYPGANARVVADVVAAPLEEQINGADGLVRIESISRDDGRYSARLYFDRTIAERAAAQRIEKRVGLAAPSLPADLGAGVSVKVATGNDVRDLPDAVAVAVIDRGGHGWGDLQKCAAAVAKRLAAAGAIKNRALFPTDEKLIYIVLNREKCSQLGIAPRDVYKTIHERGASLKADNLKDVAVGKTKVPLAQVVDVREIIGPAAIYRVNLHPAIRITGMPPAGTTAAEAAGKCALLAEEEIKRLGLKRVTAASVSAR